MPVYVRPDAPPTPPQVSVPASQCAWCDLGHALTAAGTLVLAGDLAEGRHRRTVSENVWVR